LLEGIFSRECDHVLFWEGRILGKKIIEKNNAKTMNPSKNVLKITSNNYISPPKFCLFLHFLCNPYCCQNKLTCPLNIRSGNKRRMLLVVCNNFELSIDSINELNSARFNSILREVPSHLISRVLNFAKNREPYFASIKFRVFERKLELERIKFFLFFNM